ncbi:MAG: TrmH family RNA methyltransferase [Bacteroidota bacterium]
MIEYQKKLIHHLSDFITPRRLCLIDKVIQNRTRYITAILENIYQPHNASAVLRSCECFGIQDVHILEKSHEYVVNPDVALGANKWLSIYKYKTGKSHSIPVLHQLKEKGYRIIATTPHTENNELEAFDVQKGKFALCFGTELEGLSEEIMGLADEHLKIPICGFTESFNISVSAAIMFYTLSHKIKNSNVQWPLSDIEKNELKLQWLKKSINRSDLIIKEFNKKQTNG